MTWIAIESGAEAALPDGLCGRFQVRRGDDDAGGWCVAQPS